MNADLRRGQDTIPVTEIAVRLGIGINQAYAGLAAGQLPGRKVGKRWIIPRAAFDRFLAGADTKAA